MAARSTSTALPYELLCCVIRSTRNVQTLDNWCIATELHPSLHKVCMQTRWASVTIKQTDFIAPPENRDLSYSHDPQKLINKITCSVDNPSFAHSPLDYIKHVRLCFNFSTPSSFIGQEGFEEYRMEELPCSEDLHYSLATFLPYCIALSELNHEGVLHQENLDLITDLVKAPLRTLQLRQIRPRFPARWRHPHPPYGLLRNGRDDSGHRYDDENTTLRWNNLSRLRLLQTLEISQLYRDEGISLAKAVGELVNLEKLLIVTYSRFCPEISEELNYLFNYIFPADHSTLSVRRPCRLPPRLKSLAFSDPDSRHVFVNEPTPAQRTIYPALKEIFLDIENLTALENIFNWLQMPVLERFAVPAVITIPILDPWGCYPPNEELGIVDPAYPNHVKFINSMIQKHETTLHQVTLFNAWQDGSSDCSGTVRELSHDWVCSFATQELVLGTLSPDLYHVYALTRIPEPNLLRDYYYMFRKAVNGPQWGSDLRRLRIDLVDFEGLSLDGFVTPALANLKTLMLYPWSAHSTTLPPNTPLPSDPSTFKEGQIALDIISKNLPRLRVLAIGGYRFWVEQRPATDGTGPKLWHLSHARADAHQRLEIACHLSSRDWNFLIDIPAHPRYYDSRARPAKGRAPDCNYLFRRIPSDQMMKHRNYMVLLREAVDDDAKIQSSREGKCVGRHESGLVDLATWK